MKRSRVDARVGRGLLKTRTTPSGDSPVFANDENARFAMHHFVMVTSVQEL